MRVLIPTVERDGYPDLDLCLHSLRLYAPDWRVTVGWRGSWHPPMHLGVVYARQPDDAVGFGLAVWHLLLSVRDEDVVLVLNDDTVLTPDTAALLEADWAAVTREATKVGLVGLRSNFVAGAQNIRRHNRSRGLRHLKWQTEDRMLLVDTVYGVAFAARAGVLRETSDWATLHWYSDTLLSYDLAQRGYLHYVSRAYVHHHGSRSTPSWDAADAEAKAWLQAHRPELAGVVYDP